MFNRNLLMSLSTVSAVMLTQLSNIQEAQAHFVPAPCDFITSGGFIITDQGMHGSFGAHGGCKNGAFWGHINYVDHGTGMHINSTQITGYLIDPAYPTARDICGIARINSREESVRFRVRLVDNGEPGRDDQFGIRLSNSYLITTRSLGANEPGGGNVQLHGPNPSTTAPLPPPDEYTMCGDLVTPGPE